MTARRVTAVDVERLIQNRETVIIDVSKALKEAEQNEA